MQFYVFIEQEGIYNDLTLEDAIVKLKKKGIYKNVPNPNKGIGIQNNNNYDNDFLTIQNDKIHIDASKNIDVKIIDKIKREVN